MPSRTIITSEGTASTRKIMNQEVQRADNDSPWKEILEAYFPQAMQFFFPRTAALIDWNRPYEFLDKEFQKIAKDSEQGRRYADKLVKVWHIDGREMWLLIHIEIQAIPEGEQRDFVNFNPNIAIANRKNQWYFIK